MTAAPPGAKVHYDFTISPADSYMPELLERLAECAPGRGIGPAAALWGWVRPENAIIIVNRRKQRRV